MTPNFSSNTKNFKSSVQNGTAIFVTENNINSENLFSIG